MATYTDSFSSGWATLKLIVTTESQSTDNNTSYLKCVLKITKDKTCSSYNNGGASISMTIAGDKIYSSNAFDIRSLSVGSTKTLATKYKTITHNSDGTKSVACKASFTSGVGLGSASISNTFTCTAIPRASTITSAANVTLGNACSVKWTPKSSSLRYKLKFSLGDWSHTTDYIYPKKTTAYTYTGYTIPKNNATLFKAIPNKTEKMNVTLYSYTASGTSAIGNDGDTFTVTVPELTSGSYITQPTVGTITPTLGSIPYNNTTRNDILVKTKSTITISKSGTWKEGYGAKPSLSYTISGPGFDSTNNFNTTGVFTSHTLTTTGALTYTITVEDSRGHSNSKTITYNDNNQLYCYDYYAPSISNFKAWRCNADKKKNSEGAYIDCSYDHKCAPVTVNGTNTNTYSITYYCTRSGHSPSSTSLPVSLSGNTASTYTVKAIIKDSYGGETPSSAYNVFGAIRVMNVNASGNGIGLGKMSEKANWIESVWPVESPGVKSTRDGRNASTIDLEADAGRTSCLEYYVTKSGQTGNPGVDGHLIHCHWDNTGGWDAQLLLQDKDGEMHTRGCNSGTWGSWRKQLDSVNYTSYVAPKPVSINTNTGSGTITLSESAANFSYIEILYRQNVTVLDTNSYVYGSVKIYNPNGRVAETTIAYTAKDESTLYIKSSYYLISGTSITKKNSSHTILKTGTSSNNYGTTVYKDGDSTSITPSSGITIYKVLGYK